MSIFVRYSVPVLAEIDLASGEVVRVQVDDEAVSGPDEVFVVDEPVPVEAELLRARAVADRMPWPAWELGG